MEADDIITIGVIVRELEKEGVGHIQATRIGKAVVKALGFLHEHSTNTDRHI